jgi:hypothetical protein
MPVALGRFDQPLDFVRGEVLAGWQISDIGAAACGADGRRCTGGAAGGALIRGSAGGGRGAGIAYFDLRAYCFLVLFGLCRFRSPSQRNRLTAWWI